MQCVHCLEEMNEGATVCKVCARAQPPTQAQSEARRARLMLGILVALAAVAAIWFYTDYAREQGDVADIIACAHSRGHDLTPDFVQYEIKSATVDNGSYEKGVQAVKLNYCLFPHPL